MPKPLENVSLFIRNNPDDLRKTNSEYIKWNLKKYMKNRLLTKINARANTDELNDITHFTLESILLRLKKKLSFCPYSAKEYF